MDAAQFTMWLQGFAELSPAPPTQEQWQSIRDHLQLVFKKVTPPVEVKKSEPLKQSVDGGALQRMFEQKKQQPSNFPPSYPVWPSPFMPYYLDTRVTC